MDNDSCKISDYRKDKRSMIKINWTSTNNLFSNNDFIYEVYNTILKEFSNVKNYDGIDKNLFKSELLKLNFENKTNLNRKYFHFNALYVSESVLV